MRVSRDSERMDGGRELWAAEEGIGSHKTRRCAPESPSDSRQAPAKPESPSRGRRRTLGCPERDLLAVALKRNGPLHGEDGSARKTYAAGIARQPGRSSLSLPDRTVIAHELGHTAGWAVTA